MNTGKGCAELYKAVAVKQIMKSARKKHLERMTVSNQVTVRATRSGRYACCLPELENVPVLVNASFSWTYRARVRLAHHAR